MNRDVFHAIADPTRRAILMSIRTETQNINTIAEQFEMSRQAVSLHLKYLEECGVISITKSGRQRFCQLEPQELAKIDDWLTPFKLMWEQRFDQLDAILDEMKKTDNTASK